jgi:hypothetical protein
MDSDNILSILAALGQAPLPAPATNVLQSVAPPAPPVGAPVVQYTPPPQAPAPQPPATPAAAPEPPHKKRQSVIDIIGRIADTIATVGGAQPLYQPTLEHREDRLNQVDMDALKKTLAQQQVTHGALQEGIDDRKRIGTALGALAGREDAATLWPSIAEQANIDPQRAAAIGHILENNPGAAGIFAKSLGADIDNLGKNVYFGTDPQGKTVAYQVGPDGQPHILDFGGKLAPSDPIKVVNTGGVTAIVGQGGQTKRILPNTEAPGKAADRTSRENIARGNNQTAITIAGMPARSKGAAGAGGDNSAFIQTAQGNLDELRSIYEAMHKAGTLVSPTQSTAENIAARTRASGVGQTLEGFTGSQAQTQRDRIASIRPQLMQSLAKATGMTGKQLDSNADVKLFMQTVTDPSKSFEANMKAIDGLERFLKANVKKAPAAPAGNSGGWGKASVVGG